MKTHFKQLIQSLLISTLLSLLFLLYMWQIGIPKTQARNYYNKGVVNLEKGNKKQAELDFEKAMIYWEEDYIKRKLEEIN